MNVSATTWNTLSKLLDEALDLEPTARADWFDRLSATQPALAPSVRKLLEAHASSETADVLARLPTLGSASTATRATALSPGDRIGPYRLKRELGAGGMADVWLAERADGAFERDVALKLPMINRLRRDLAQRFARERDILARLEHPNIARLYDAGVTDDGLPYLAMEYVDGQSITEYCDAQKAGVPERLRLFIQVLEAVQFAHANLIIHRDIKPSNILITSKAEARLLDFGIAKLLERGEADETQLTRLAGRVLTPDYAAPEQIKGESVSTATDVYSLAVVAFELLTHKRPYRLRRGSAAELEEAIAEADVLSASAAVTDKRLKRQLAGDLDAILNKALKKPPEQRYLTVDAFAADIRRHLNQEPVSARPDSLWYRASRVVLRHKLETGVLVAMLIAIPAGAVAQIAVMIAIAAGAGIALWQGQVARQQARHAVLQAQRAEAVRDFLGELFQASGSQQRSAHERRSMTAVQLLDRGADRIDNLQHSAPEAHAYLLNLFGEIYEDLGLYERSLQLHQQNVTASRTLYGVDAHATVMAALELAWILNKLERTEEAWSLVQHAQSTLRRIEPHSADYAQALYFESQIFKHKDPKRAVRAAEAAIRLIEEIGVREYRGAMARWAYATALLGMGDSERAVVEFRKTADELEALFGADYVHLGTLNDELAGALRTLGRFDEARDALVRALNILDKNQRPTLKASTLLRLSSLLQATGDANGARDQMEMALEERLRTSEAGNPTVEHLHSHRAILFVEQGDLDKGVDELLRVQQLIPSSSHLAHLAICDTLTRAYLMLGKPLCAREQVQRGKTLLEQHGAVSGRVFALASAAAQLAAYEGKGSEAELELEIARKTVNKTLATDAAKLALLEARVAQSLGLHEEARSITTPWIDRLLNAPISSLDLGLRGQLALIAAAAHADTDPALTHQLAAKAVDLLRRTQVPGSPLLQQARTALDSAVGKGEIVS